MSSGNRSGSGRSRRTVTTPEPSSLTSTEIRYGWSARKTPHASPNVCRCSAARSSRAQHESKRSQPSGLPMSTRLRSGPALPAQRQDAGILSARCSVPSSRPLLRPADAVRTFSTPSRAARSACRRAAPARHAGRAASPGRPAAPTGPRRRRAAPGRREEGLTIWRGVLLAANRPGHERSVKSAYGVATRSATPTLDPAPAPWETGTYEKDGKV